MSSNEIIKAEYLLKPYSIALQTHEKFRHTGVEDRLLGIDHENIHFNSSIGEHLASMYCSSVNQLCMTSQLFCLLPTPSTAAASDAIATAAPTDVIAVSLATRLYYDFTLSYKEACTYTRYRLVA